MREVYLDRCLDLESYQHMTEAKSGMSPKIEKCVLCGKDTPNPDSGYRVTMCMACSRDLSYYGSE